MKKVVCIDRGVTKGVPPVFEGEVYTVVSEGELPEGKYTYHYYILAERPADCAYGRLNFIPISQIDETSFERDYNEAKQLI